MYGGGLLPKTGPGAIALGVAGHTVNAPAPLVIAAVGVGIVLTGTLVVRATFRRRKAVGSA